MLRFLKQSPMRKERTSCQSLHVGLLIDTRNSTSLPAANNVSLARACRRLRADFAGSDGDKGLAKPPRRMQMDRKRRRRVTDKEREMTLSKKTLLVIISTMIPLLAILGAVVGTVVGASFSRIEHESAQRDAMRARDALQQLVSATDTKCQDWSHWDDLWIYMKTKDKAFADGNLMDEVPDTLKVDLMMLVDIKGEVLFFSDTELRSGNTNMPRSDRIRMFRSALPGLKDGRLKGMISGIMAVASKPLIFTSQPIKRTNGSGENRGTILMARWVGDKTVQLLAKTTHLDVACTPFESGLLPAGTNLQKALRQTNDIQVVAQGDEVRSYAKIVDVAGRPAALMTVKSPRTVYLQGRRTITMAFGAIVVAGMCLAFAAWITFRRTVLNRLARLCKQVSQIAVGDHGLTRVDAGSDDELGQLARLTNRMLDSKDGQTRALKQAHEALSSLMSSIAFALILFDESGRVVTSNAVAQRLFPGKLLPTEPASVWDLPIGWDTAVLSEDLADRSSREECLYSETATLSLGPAAGVYDLAVVRVASGTEGGSRFLLSAVDVTQQHILQAKLSQSQKLESIGQLAAGIAHEINTPTQYVMDNVRFLQDAGADLIGVVEFQSDLIQELGDTEAGARAVELLKAKLSDKDVPYLIEQIPPAIAQSIEGLGRVSSIVGAMKEFSHPDGKSKAPADINRAIESTVSVSRSTWKYVAKLEMQLEPKLPMVDCSMGEVNQVILNLIVNAAHAIEEAQNGGDELGMITVRTRSLADERIEISVSDTGCGIPESAQARVFDPFFTTKDVGRGTGQGLSIAHNVIVNHHGGTIDFFTESGVGTTFRIVLPLRAEKPTAAEEVA
jgi:signal transduction histidine kinase